MRNLIEMACVASWPVSLPFTKPCYLVRVHQVHSFQSAAEIFELLSIQGRRILHACSATSVWALGNIWVLCRLFLAPIIGKDAPGNLGKSALDFSRKSGPLLPPVPTKKAVDTIGRNFGQKEKAESESRPNLETEIDLTGTDDEALEVCTFPDGAVSLVFTYSTDQCSN